MKDEILNAKNGSTIAKAISGSSAKYRISRIVRVGKDGSIENKAVNFETDDIEAFRKKMKGNKYSDVFLTYECL